MFSNEEKDRHGIYKIRNKLPQKISKKKRYGISRKAYGFGQSDLAKRILVDTILIFSLIFTLCILRYPLNSTHLLLLFELTPHVVQADSLQAYLDELFWIFDKKMYLQEYFEGLNCNLLL